MREILVQGREQGIDGGYLGIQASVNLESSCPRMLGFKC